MPQGFHILIIEPTSKRGEVSRQGRSGTVHGAGGVPVRPSEDDPKDPGLPPSIPSAVDSLAMFQDREALTARPIGDPIGQCSTVRDRRRRGLPEGMEEPGDATNPGSASEL